MLYICIVKYVLADEFSDDEIISCNDVVSFSMKRNWEAQRIVMPSASNMVSQPFLWLGNDNQNNNSLALGMG